MVESKITWFNGKLIPFADARLHVTAHTLHYGIGVFEGIRCYRRADGRSAVFRLREHVDRLFDSAKIATMDLPFSRAEITEACLATLRANGLAEGYLRPIAYLGAASLGLGSRDNPVEIAVLAFPWGAYLGDEGLRRGIRARVSSYTRDHMNATMSKGKICGQYVNSILAKREAQAAGADEAILLDSMGRVAEATGENVFAVFGGRLFTPPLSMPILAGVTRDSILALARRAGIEIVEDSFTRDRLYTAEEVFLTGTAAELTPVREIDGRSIGAGEPGPVTKRLQAAFFDAAKGPGTPEPAWLHFL